MERISSPLRITMHYKLTLAHVAVTVAAVLVAEAIALGALALLTRQPMFTLPVWGLHVALVAAGAALAGLLLGAWASRRVTRRLRRALEISRAWLRGNLSLRIADPTTDDLGLLAGQLDLLAGHIAQDEQDLDELRERNARLTDQVRALAVVEERNRLARELHDSVKHYALLFGAREHVLAYLEVQGNDALLPPPVAEALYRVAQEALHNVARHARATRVDVHLRCIPEFVALTVRDNGVGFDTAQATSAVALHRGLGLANMQERMLGVGGRLTVESQISCGTTVLAEVGLTHPLGSRPEIARLDRDRPSPTIENWPWLGQRLVIPVGQTWPWLPADQVHLRRPLVDPAGEPLLVKRGTGFLGLRRTYALQLGARRIRIHHGWSGYEWESQGASWALRHVRGLSGRAVLTRNGQPVAAIQHQGRLLNTWSEIVYDGRGYRLSTVKGHPGSYVLADEGGDELLTAEGGDMPQVELRRALPLPLVVMVAMRVVNDTASTTAAAEAVEAIN